MEQGGGRGEEERVLGSGHTPAPTPTLMPIFIVAFFFFFSASDCTLPERAKAACALSRFTALPCTV